MAESLFNVYITGNILEGHDPEAVKNAFGERFKLDSQRVEALIRRGKSIVKKNLDEATAAKFVKVLEHMGMEVGVEQLGGLALEPIPQTNEKGSPESQQSANNARTESVASASEANTESDNLSIYDFEFAGREGEYFRIWIVNLLLTIVTLGIYSPWAKVRNTQYIYGHTSVAGSSFAYLANPLTILKGRLIAVAAFVVYSLTAELMPILGIVLALAFLFVIPWIITRSIRFNMRMTGWRNLRFGFDGSMKGAAVAFIFWPFVGIITLGLMIPYSLYKQTEYVVNNIRLGTSEVTFEPCTGVYVKTFFIAAGIIIGAGIAGSILGMITPFMTFILILAAYLYAFAYIKVRIGNLIMDQSSLEDGQISFSSNMEEGSFIKVFLINSLLIGLTLGLWSPCAKVALTRYRLEHLQGISTFDLDSFVTAEEEKVSALGEEFGEAFDVDVGI